jgi:acetolactate synthase I/II/III large subunit
METTTIGEITSESVKSQQIKSVKSQQVELTGSQALLDALIIEGVDTIFGYPGGAIMPIYDALFD